MKVTSVQKIRKLKYNILCVKPEEPTILTDEWRVYAETDIPEGWVNKEDGTSARVDHYWDKSRVERCCEEFINKQKNCLRRELVFPSLL